MLDDIKRIGMIRKIIWILFVVLFTTFPALAAPEKTSPLDIVLTTRDRNVQRKALHTLAENKDAYQLEVKERIERLAQSGEGSPELFVLLHLAALIKCETALPILERLWLHPETDENDCIYCDPRSLVMTVFAIHQIWSPPPLSSTQAEKNCVSSTLSDLKNLKRSWSDPDLYNTYLDILDGYGEIARRTRSMDEEELLYLTTNPGAPYEIRDAASLALKSRFKDDHLLIDYYWWALNACEDASGGCYCDACEMILRAEYYGAKKQED